MLSGVPNSLFESVFTRFPFKQVIKHSLRAGIMLLPFLASDWKLFFDLCLLFVSLPVEDVEVVLMSLQGFFILKFSK